MSSLGDNLAKELAEFIREAGTEVYFVPPPGTKGTACRCTWPNGYPGQAKLNPECPIPQHARLAKKA